MKIQDIVEKETKDFLEKNKDEIINRIVENLSTDFNTIKDIGKNIKEFKTIAQLGTYLSNYTGGDNMKK